MSEQIEIKKSKSGAYSIRAKSKRKRHPDKKRAYNYRSPKSVSKNLSLSRKSEHEKNYKKNRERVIERQRDKQKKRWSYIF